MKPENNTNAYFCVLRRTCPGRPHGLSFLRDESQTDRSIYADQPDKEITETIGLFKGAKK